MTTFESFLSGKTIQFRSLDEANTFINRVLEEEDNLVDLKINNATIDHVVDKLMTYMQTSKPKYKEIFTKRLENLSQVKLNKLYYKNNIYPFLDNEIILDLYREILSHDVSFTDPNKVPQIYKDSVDKLWSYLKEYVFHNYIIQNKIEILKHAKRSTVLGIDTDSNFRVPRCI
jgi:hypothetical protein